VVLSVAVRLRKASFSVEHFMHYGVPCSYNFGSGPRRSLAPGLRGWFATVRDRHRSWPAGIHLRDPRSRVSALQHESHDLGTSIAVPSILALVALGVSLFPAWRAGPYGPDHRFASRITCGGSASPRGLPTQCSRTVKAGNTRYGPRYRCTRLRLPWRGRSRVRLEPPYATRADINLWL